SFLFRADTPPEHAMQILDGVYVSTNGELLRKLLARDKPMEGLHIFVGHSGWAHGQLEAEIARGDWTLAPAETDAIFHGKSDRPACHCLHCRPRLRKRRAARRMRSWVIIRPRPPCLSRLARTACYRTARSRSCSPTSRTALGCGRRSTRRCSSRSRTTTRSCAT